MTDSTKGYVEFECPRCHSGLMYNKDDEGCVDCEYDFEPEDYPK